jgi:hypothetical protein
MSREIFTREDWDGYKSRNITPKNLPSHFSGLMRRACDPCTWGMVDDNSVTTKYDTEQMQEDATTMESSQASEEEKQRSGKRQKYKTETLNKALVSKRWMNVRTKGGGKKKELRPEHTIYQLKPNDLHNHASSNTIKMFYTMSPWSNVCFAGIDLDELDDTTQEDMDRAVEDIRGLFGYKVYAERSTKGAGRHIYPVIDFTPFAEAWYRYPRVPREEDSRESFSEACNRILFKDPCSLHHMLTEYFEGKYNLNYDGVKGIYTSYRSIERNGYYLVHPRKEKKEDEWVETEESHTYLQRTYGAIILKMPKLTSPEVFHEFTRSPIISLLELVGIIRKLLLLLGYMDEGGIITSAPNNPIRSSHIFRLYRFEYPSSQVSRHDAEKGEGSGESEQSSAEDCLVPVAAHADLPSATTNTSWLQTEQPKGQGSAGGDTTPISIPIANIGGTFTTHPPQSSCLRGHRKDLLASIEGEKETLWRSRRYLEFCYRCHMDETGREPTKEQYRREYRRDVGTGVEDEGDIGRLNSTYDKYITEVREFYRKGVEGMIKKIENNIDMMPKQIRELRNEVCRAWEAGTKLAGISSTDLAIAALWLFSTLMQPRNSRHAKFDRGRHDSRQLTAPMAGLIGYFSTMKACGLSKTSCDRKKAKILREMLIALGWIQIVDHSYIIGGKDNGRAWRYILLPKHPMYRRFVEHVGGGKIQWWKARAEQEQLDQGEQIA